MLTHRWIPTILPRHDPTAPGLDLYTAMLSERIVFLAEPLDDTVAVDIAAQLLYLDATADSQISLYLNAGNGGGGGSGGSGGNGDDDRGPVDPSGTAMTIVYDAIRGIGADVETVCLGQATAAIAALLAAGTPGKRLIAPGARVALHEPVSAAWRGRADDLAIQAVEIRRHREFMIKILSEHTGRTVDRVDADLRRSMILSAPEAIAYGLADHLVATRAGRPQLAGTAR